MLLLVFSDDADWFLKADDDTYIIMENLKAFLSEHDTSEPLQFGCKLQGRKSIVFGHKISSCSSYTVLPDHLKVLLNKIYIHIDLYPVQQIEPRGYMSGGAGYVLSKEALHRFVTQGLVR